MRKQAIVFSGASSSDADGDPLTYQWDFGDESTGTGVSPTHAYATLGDFTVSLVVNDGTTSSAPATAAVTITNQAPVAVAGGPYAGVRNQAIAFSGVGSSDPDGDPLTYQWDFGDGATGTGVSPTHAYATLGDFTVTLVVNDGTTSSAPATAMVTIANQAPVAAAGGPYGGVRNQAIVFSGVARATRTATRSRTSGTSATGRRDRCVADPRLRDAGRLHRDPGGQRRHDQLGAGDGRGDDREPDADREPDESDPCGASTSRRP